MALARAAEAQELLDAPAPVPDLEKNLQDVARLNRFFGGAWLVRTQLARFLEGIPTDRSVTILDVGTGGADIPVALVDWARRRGRSIRLLALDRSEQVLAIAHQRAARCSEIVLLEGDGRNLPVKTGGVDVALLSLTLHHLEPSEAATLLAELNQATRLGFIVSDLIRSRPAYCLVWLATRLFARSRVARHDGPLSVLRAYTVREILELAARAGLPGVRVVRYPWLCRLALVVKKG